mmetsp:Transcript_10549/g.28864  ORF Transcript_10549/g.28864 Transcript_10549/m.28864 type:complete len:90 (-) Transcript_10549:4719-4988(-)
MFFLCSSSRHSAPLPSPLPSSTPQSFPPQRLTRCQRWRRNKRLRLMCDSGGPEEHISAFSHGFYCNGSGKTSSGSKRQNGRKNRLCVPP